MDSCWDTDVLDLIEQTYIHIHREKDTFTIYDSRDRKDILLYGYPYWKIVRVIRYFVSKPGNSNENILSRYSLIKRLFDYITQNTYVIGFIMDPRNINFKKAVLTKLLEFDKSIISNYMFKIWYRRITGKRIKL